jgi:hypothetical protein
MISAYHFSILVAFALLAWYWIDRMRSQELARAAGKKACKFAGVQLLDDTVELTRLRIRRDHAGQPRFYREFRFEFTDDGDVRYRGAIAMLGQQVLDIVLEGEHEQPAPPTARLH